MIGFCRIGFMLSLIRYSALKNKEYLQSLNYYLVIGILFLISLIYYLPVLFFNEIIQIIDRENRTSIDEFMVITNSLGLSLYGITTPIILSTIRIVLAMFVLTGINIMNIIEFKKRYSYRFNNKVFDISESIYFVFIYILLLS